jgi:hypothetical protein
MFAAREILPGWWRVGCRFRFTLTLFAARQILVRVDRLGGVEGIGSCSGADKFPGGDLPAIGV